MDGFPNAHLLTTPARLAAALDAPSKPLVIDLRPAEDFAAGHVPRAVHLDLWGLSLVDTDPGPLKAFMWIVDHLFNLRGVTASTPIVVYDEQSGMRAAREAAPPATSTWTGTPQEEKLATWRDVRARLGQPGVVILDTRSDAEYHGTFVRAKRGGAIPGAVHVEWTRNLGPDGAFKPASELRAMYEASGVTPDKEVVTYCQGGYRAAHAYLALRLLGYPRVRNYTGSWKEWGDREDLPIERP
jgi:thiosulfate/3-mercaptopyruvate sulfurtransferase